MINPYYFTDENLEIGFKINLDSHNINHANSILGITPDFPKFGVEFSYFKKILKEMATFYARLINQYKFKYRTLFSASFYRIDEEDQICDDVENFISLKIIANLTETYVDNIDVKSQSEHQIRIQETKKSEWIFGKFN